MSEIPKKCGIYLITNKINGKMYVGKSINMYKRINYRHKRSQNPNIKPESFLHKAIQKYGWKNFEVKILEEYNSINNTLLLDRESYWIKKLGTLSTNNGYNIVSYSTDCTGLKRTKEQKEKRKNRPIKSGWKHSIESKKRMSDSTKLQDFSKWNVSVNQIDPITNEIIKTWISIKSACIAIFGSYVNGGNITSVCKKTVIIKQNGNKYIRKTVGGFKWEYNNDKPRYT